MKRRRFLTLSAAFACAPSLSYAARWEGLALGADVSVSLEGPREAVQDALPQVPDWLDEIEQLFSLYRSDSVLSGLNHTGRTNPPGLFRALLDAVDKAHALTDGLFDPTVQPLWDALAQGHDPGPARALIGWDRVHRGFGEIRLAPGQMLTLNGIAQGFATDSLRAALKRKGFTKALVNIGEFSALGGPFRLGLSDPAFGQVGQVTLSDRAIATSSPGALRLGNEAHILGPRGEPPLWSTVSIEGPDTTLADALSTAAVFMPAARLARLKQDAGLSRILTVDFEGNLRSI